MSGYPGIWLNAAAVLLVHSIASAQSPQLWFPTGPPEFIEPSAPAAPGQPLLTRDEYSAFVAKVTEGPLVPIRRFPDSLSPNARFGFNFVFGGKNRGFAVDGDEANGYVLYADANGDGDLVDDPPIRLEKRDGYYTTLFKASVTDTDKGESYTFAIQIRFMFVRISTPSGPRLGWRTANTTVRLGTIVVGDQRTTFALIGTPGNYDKPGSALWVDLDGDNQGMWDTKSVERFQPVDKRIKIGGMAYELQIDPYGRSVALTPLDHQIPARLSLESGTLAPKFSLADVNGQRHRLTDYHGKVLLVDIWAVWCGPCRVEAPKLATLYQRYRDRGLAILGISPDSPEDIRKYVQQFDHQWPQVSESFEGVGHRLFRIAGSPTHFLIDRKGRIVMAQEGDIDAEAFERLLNATLR